MENSVCIAFMKVLNSSRLFTKIKYDICEKAKNVMEKTSPNDARGFRIPMRETARVRIRRLNLSNLVNLIVTANRMNEIKKP